MKQDYFPKVLSILKDLKKKYPSLEIGRHISGATADYEDIWGLPDKELYFALTKYQETLEINDPLSKEEDIQSIIKGGMDLDSLMRNDEDDDIY